MEIQAVLTDQKIIQHFNALPKEIDKAVKSAVSAVANEMIREVRGKEGLSMFGRHKPNTPTPSQPGQPPAQITGDLRKSVKKFPVTRHGHGDYSVSVMPTAPYARIQELGGGRLPARPYMEPARNRLRKDRGIERMFARKMFMELKKRHT